MDTQMQTGVEIRRIGKASTAWYVFFYGKSPISWGSKKEPIVALSLCESEYVAASMSHKCG